MDSIEEKGAVKKSIISGVIMPRIEKLRYLDLIT